MIYRNLLFPHNFSLLTTRLTPAIRKVAEDIAQAHPFNKSVRQSIRCRAELSIDFAQTMGYLQGLFQVNQGNSNLKGNWFKEALSLELMHGQQLTSPKGGELNQRDLR